MRDLNRYVKNRYAVYWKDIAFELDIDYAEIDKIEENHSKCEERLFCVLKAWYNSKNNLTWRDLEDAISNAIKIKNGETIVGPSK